MLLPKGNRNRPEGERSRKADVTDVTTLLLMNTFYTETWLTHREHNGTGKYSERGVELYRHPSKINGQISTQK